MTNKDEIFIKIALVKNETKYKHLTNVNNVSSEIFITRIMRKTMLYYKGQWNALRHLQKVNMSLL